MLPENLTPTHHKVDQVEHFMLHNEDKAAFSHHVSGSGASRLGCKGVIREKNYVKSQPTKKGAMWNNKQTILHCIIDMYNGNLTKTIWVVSLFFLLLQVKSNDLFQKTPNINWLVPNDHKKADESVST